MDWPYLTTALPGTGGLLRRQYADFQVEEIPLYAPCGSGEHLFLWLRKEGVSTFEAIRRIARALDVPERHVGYAGLKDARAVTAQWLSVTGAPEERVRALHLPDLRIERVVRHKNKLKVGHLRGNRFRIRVSSAHPDAAARAAAVLDVLVARGAPNYFGEQRFGHRQDSHLYGAAVLRKDYDEFVRLFLGNPSHRENDSYLRRARELFDEGRLEEAYRMMPVRHRAEKKALHALLRFRSTERAYFAIPKRMRRMFLSAFQSILFNRLVAERIDSMDRLEDGDLAYLHRNGAIFPVPEARVEQVRCDAFEISPSGPLFGTSSPLAVGAPGERERRLLEGSGFTRESFEVGGGIQLKGLRRPLRLPLREVALHQAAPGEVTVTFALPSGSFATAVMREILKS